MRTVVQRIFGVTLWVSAAVQLGFGVALLAAPRDVLSWGDVPWAPALTSQLINLGALIVLCGVLSVLAYRWTRRGVDAGIVLGLCVGATLLLMAVLHAAHGLYTPVVFDGGRGLLLLTTGTWLWARRAPPTPRPPSLTVIGSSGT